MATPFANSTAPFVPQNSTSVPSRLPGSYTDRSNVRDPMELVRRVDANPNANARDKAQADQIRQNPGKFRVTQGVVVPEAGWWARHAPGLAWTALGAIATAGVGSVIAGSGAGGATVGSGGTMAAPAMTAVPGGLSPVASGLVAPTGAGMGLGRTALKYGAQYGLPAVGDLINGRRQSNATRDAARLEQEGLDKALAQEKEEQLYRRGFDEDARQYARRIDEYERSKYEEGTGYERGKYGDATGYDREKYNEGEGYKRAQYNEGTNYNRRNYGNFVETLEPYRAGGQAANQFASRLMGQNVPEYTGGTYYDVARDARTPVNLPTDVNLRTNVNVPTGAPGLSFPGSTGGSGAILGPNGRGPDSQGVSTTMPVDGTGGGGASGYMARDWTSGQLTGPDGRVVNLPTGGEQFDLSPEARERLRMMMENGEIQTRGGGRRA